MQDADDSNLFKRIDFIKNDVAALRDFIIARFDVMANFDDCY